MDMTTSKAHQNRLRKRVQFLENALAHLEWVASDYEEDPKGLLVEDPYHEGTFIDYTHRFALLAAQITLAHIRYHQGPDTTT